MDANKVKEGFNKGYLLRTHTPEIAEKLSKILSGRKDAYAIGFVAGIKEREKELLKSRGKNYKLNKVYPKDRTPSKEKDLDKDIGR